MPNPLRTMVLAILGLAVLVIGSPSVLGATPAARRGIDPVNAIAAVALIVCAVMLVLEHCATRD
jgi:hypothetical protein